MHIRQKRRTRGTTRLLVGAGALVLFTTAFGTSQRVQAAGLLDFLIGLLNPETRTAADVPSIKPLGQVSVPRPSDLGQYVVNERAAIALGKALFWEVRVGADTKTACASCHFHAGTDNRSVNSLNPGPDTTFSFAGPNQQLAASDFPFHKLSDPKNRKSPVIWDRNERTSSQGVLLSAHTPADTVQVFDPIFNVNGRTVRRVEPRQTPSVFDAVFNTRNFWDGRARGEFNGVTPFGPLDDAAYVMKYSTLLKSVSPVKVRIERSSLASQAVGPPLSDFEMSAIGRTFPDIGRMLIGARPLALQTIDRYDSVLAPYLELGGAAGMKGTYGDLIRAAFHPQWWSAPKAIKVVKPGSIVTATTGVPDGYYSQMEQNFSLFFGLAIQMYESTLVSDETPFDKYLEGDRWALSDSAVRGFDIFKDKCSSCHSGAALSGATFENPDTGGDGVEFMKMGDGNSAHYDAGFYNIGVRPTPEDPGVGGTAPNGKPLAFSASKLGRKAVKGAFKTAQLRNVALTAPYFHNGGQLTLRQVVEFYNRGGDFREQNIADLDPDIETLNLGPRDIDDVVAFLKSLTDERVKLHRAPFDHPSLHIANGHANSPFGPFGLETWFDELPAVGANGYTKGTPTFLEPAGGWPEAPKPSVPPMDVRVYVRNSRLVSAGAYVDGRDGGWVGTKGQRRPLEGYELNILPDMKGASIEYLCDVYPYGPSSWVPAGTYCGTEGKSGRLQMLAMRVAGPDAAQYSVEYRCHIEDSGDSPIKRDGEACGSASVLASKVKQIESIAVTLKRR